MRTEYDNLRRKVKVTAPEGNFATFTYDARSNVLTEYGDSIPIPP